MNVQTAATGARTGALYLGVIIAAIYLVVLAISPFMVVRLYRLNAELTARAIALEAKQQARPERQAPPVVMNFYGGPEFIPGGELFR